MMFFPPSLFLISCGLLLPFLSSPLRKPLVLAIPLFSLWYLWLLPSDAALEVAIAGFHFIPLILNPFALMFATVFLLALFIGALFALGNPSRIELPAAFIYAGSAVGITCAGDLLMIFIYWEIMALASTFIVWIGGTKQSGTSGLRYAYMHLLGGVVLLTGIMIHIFDMGGDATTISFQGNADGTLASYVILAGILINAAAPPFSSWLPDAYPNSSPTGAVFLSAFTTKTAVYLLITLFAGYESLIYIGLFMIFHGIIYAMLENDIRRILSYSIINQVGFMVVGVGIGTPLALAGAAAHAFCHIIYKSLLFMSAGAVIHMTGQHKASALGGLYHSMKFTTFCAIVGALSISAFPLTSGFVSKSIIIDAVHHEHLTLIWHLLLAASAGVFLHAGIKFPWFVFFQKDSGLRPKEPPLHMRLAMLLAVIGCFAPALAPQLFYKLLPYPIEFTPYTPAHIVGQLQLLLFSALAFFLMLPFLKRTLTITLDFDWLYRVLVRNFLLWLEKHSLGCIKTGSNIGIGFWLWLERHILTISGPHGIGARNWGIAATTLATTALLGILLILYFLQTGV